jgi:hypothetical protein
MNRCLYCSRGNDHICFGIMERLNLNEINLNDFMWDMLFLYEENKELAKKKWDTLELVMSPINLIIVCQFMELNNYILLDRQIDFIKECLNKFYIRLKNLDDKYNEFSIKKYINILNHYKFI